MDPSGIDPGGLAAVVCSHAGRAAREPWPLVLPCPGVSRRMDWSPIELKIEPRHPYLGAALLSPKTIIYAPSLWSPLTDGSPT